MNPNLNNPSHQDMQPGPNDNPNGIMMTGLLQTMITKVSCLVLKAKEVDPDFSSCMSDFLNRLKEHIDSVDKVPKNNFQKYSSSLKFYRFEFIKCMRDCKKALDPKNSNVV